MIIGCMQCLFASLHKWGGDSSYMDLSWYTSLSWGILIVQKDYRQRLGLLWCILRASSNVWHSLTKQKPSPGHWVHRCYHPCLLLHHRSLNWHTQCHWLTCHSSCPGCKVRCTVWMRWERIYCKEVRADDDTKRHLNIVDFVWSRK